MNFDLTGIKNQNEYFTNHYFSTIFAENAGETITAWKSKGNLIEHNQKILAQKNIVRLNTIKSQMINSTLLKSGGHNRNILQEKNRRKRPKTRAKKFFLLKKPCVFNALRVFGGANFKKIEKKGLTA